MTCFFEYRLIEIDQRGNIAPLEIFGQSSRYIVLEHPNRNCLRDPIKRIGDLGLGIITLMGHVVLVVQLNSVYDP
jgi:hypothetical protein